MKQIYFKPLTNKLVFADKQTESATQVEFLEEKIIKQYLIQC